MDRESGLGILGLKPEASTAEVEKAYQLKRGELDKRVQSAPTAGLKNKYESELKELKKAYEAALSPQSSSGTGLSRTMLSDLPRAKPVEAPGSKPKEEEPAPSGGGGATIEPGQVILDRYEIERLIASGGMGAVYEAFDRNRQEKIAIKVLLPDFLASDVARERFFAEAKISTKLSHPNIVNVFDLQKLGDQYFLTMELLEGRSLRDEMDKHKSSGTPFSVQDAKRVGKALCDALSYAHRFTVHRDVKPENVWLSQDGTVKLMDFGIARLADSQRLTMATTTMGTAYYMASEQVKGARDVDHRADQYSTGAVLFEMLTGELPTGRIKSAHKLRSDVPHAVSLVLDRALANKPDERFPDMKQFGRALTASAFATDKLLLVAAAVIFLVVVVGGYSYYQSKSVQWEREKRYTTAITQARSALEDKQWDTAASAFKKALEVRPQSEEAREGLKESERGALNERYQSAITAGNQALKDRKPEIAERSFRRALEVRPGDATASEALEKTKTLAVDVRFEREMAEAKTALERKQWDEARNGFNRALAIKPKDRAALYGLQQVDQGIKDATFTEFMQAGHAALVKRGWDKAQEAFQKALEVKPDSLEALKGIKQANLGTTDEIYDEYMKAGRAALVKEAWDKAFEEFNKAAELKPDDLEALKGKKQAEGGKQNEKYRAALREGTAALGKRQWDEAIKAFDRALKAKPDDRTALESRQKAETGQNEEIYRVSMEEGMASITDGKWRDAEKAFTRAVEAKPLDEEAAQKLAEAQKRVEQLRLEEIHSLTQDVLAGGPKKGAAPTGPATLTIFEAAKNGDVGELKRVVAAGADVNVTDADNVTPLTWACDAGHGEIVKLLLDKGANPSAKDNLGATPLMWAAKQGDPKIAEMLLAKGAEIDSQDKYGSTAMMWAAAEGKYDVVKLLLEKGANGDIGNSDGLTPLILAAEAGDADVIKTLLDKGAKINFKASDGRTALYGAVEKGHLDAVKLLLKRGADPDIETINRWTPLMAAVDAGNAEMVKVLLEHGARKMVSQAKRLASMRGDKQIVNLLRSSGR